MFGVSFNDLRDVILLTYIHISLLCRQYQVGTQEEEEEPVPVITNYATDTNPQPVQIVITPPAATAVSAPELNRMSDAGSNADALNRNHEAEAPIANYDETTGYGVVGSNNGQGKDMAISVNRDAGNQAQGGGPICSMNPDRCCSSDDCPDTGCCNVQYGCVELPTDRPWMTKYLDDFCM